MFMLPAKPSKITRFPHFKLLLSCLTFQEWVLLLDIRKLLCYSQIFLCSAPSKNDQVIVIVNDQRGLFTSAFTPFDHRHFRVVCRDNHTHQVKWTLLAHTYRSQTRWLHRHGTSNKHDQAYIYQQNYKHQEVQGWFRKLAFASPETLR